MSSILENRRDFLRAVGVISGSVLLTACEPRLRPDVKQVVQSTYTPSEETASLLSESRFWEMGETAYVSLDALDRLDEVHVFPKGVAQYVPVTVLQGYEPFIHIQGRDTNGKMINEEIEGFENKEQLIFDGLMSQTQASLTMEAHIHFRRGARVRVQYNPEKIIFTDGYTKEKYPFDGVEWRGPDWRVDPIIKFEEARLVEIDVSSNSLDGTQQAFVFNKLFQTVSVHSNDPIEIVSLPVS